MAEVIQDRKPKLLKTFLAPDVQFAIGLIAVIFMMVIPLPTLFLDMLLSISITVGILILLVSIYVKEPLDFSTFPTILLLATLFRLALNVATTRSILLDGAGGDVSSVIKSFGEFVVGGNYFVGFVIFLILVIINFIVISKGAGRVAEVGARFTLDAMPGKQMSIDAELNAGIIDKDEAKAKRSKIEREADFYGAMDGSSKFVRGDAIAGILITGINIVMGLVVGIAQHDMSFSEAAAKFTLLTVGDGLVSQIPALIISVAAGIVVTRAANENTLSDDLTTQMLVHPKAMYISSGMLLILALVPGLPIVPFLALSIGAFFLGRYSEKEKVRQEQAAIALEKADAQIEAPDEDSVESLLHVDTLSLEVGVGLIPLVDSDQDGEILERIVSSRKQFAQDLGIVVPMVMVRDNIQLRPGEYQILLKGNPIASGNLMPDYQLAMAPEDVFDPIEGIKTQEPAYGLDAVWIKSSQKDEASFRGYTVVNCSTVITTHLTKVIQDNCANLLGRQETQNLIDSLKANFPKVVEEVVSSDRLSLGEVVKVLQNLLGEGVSVRDLLSIFEALADQAKTIRHPDALTKYVRRALGRSICRKYLSPENDLVVTSLDRAVEDLLISGLQQNEDGSTSLNVDPEIAQNLLNNIATGMDVFQTTGTVPVLLCGSRIRWDLHKIISRFIPGLIVLAFDEIPNDIQTRNVGIISL
jgi:flagellar biosynthesis protein FlhA